MNTSAFNPDLFLDMEMTAPLERRPPLPIGDYTATIGDVTARQWQSKTDVTKSGIAYDVPLILEVPAEIQVALGLHAATLTVRDSIMLDLTDAGTIDQAPGRNRALRAYREATDTNKAGEVFRTRDLVGKLVKVKVSHRLWNNEPVEQVDGVVRL